MAISPVKKWTIIILSLIGFTTFGITAYFIHQVAKKNTHSLNSNDEFIYIPSGCTLPQFFEILQNHPIAFDQKLLKITSKLINFREKNVKPGRYKIGNPYTYLSVFRLLKNGQQTPVNVILNNVRTLEELAERVSKYLEPDKIEFQNFFFQTHLIDTLYIKPDQLMCFVIPNTYQFLWNTGADGFLSRMIKEHQKFWNSENRKQKADSLNMDPCEVYTLASIVEKETQVKYERPTVAGLYLNRLRQNIPLQADPTVIFAIGDFNIQRVLYQHLQYDSPFNTYLYEGLPPGPICMASINSIDAVLNAEQHDFIYMCAKPGLSGEHVFTSNYQEHLRNAAKYRQWLTKYLKDKENQ